MDYIVTVLKHVAYYLENEYVPDTLLLELSSQLRKQQEDREYVNQSIDALALQKPGFFSRKKHKKEYKEKLKEYSDQLQNIILNEHLIKTKETECENQNKDLLGEVNKKKEEINQSQEEAKRYEDSFRADTYLS